MEIQSEDFGSVKILRIQGELVAGTMRNLREIVGVEIARGTKRILLDMRNVTLVDSSGLGLLAKAVSAARGTGGELALFGVGDTISRTIKFGNMGARMAVFGTEGAALKAFG